MHTLMALAYFILVGSQDWNKNQTLSWNFGTGDIDKDINGDLEFVDGKTFKEQRAKTVTNLKWNDETKEIESYNYDKKLLDHFSIPELLDYLKNKEKFITSAKFKDDMSGLVFFNVDGKESFTLDTPNAKIFNESRDKYFTKAVVSEDKTKCDFLNYKDEVISTLDLAKGGGITKEVIDQYFKNITYNSASGDLTFKDDQGTTLNVVNIPSVKPDNGNMEPDMPTGKFILNKFADMDASYPPAPSDIRSWDITDWSVRLNVLNLTENETIASDTNDNTYGFGIDKILIKTSSKIYEALEGTYSVGFTGISEANIKRFYLSNKDIYKFKASDIFVGANNNLIFDISLIMWGSFTSKDLSYGIQSRVNIGVFKVVPLDTKNCTVETDLNGNLVKIKPTSSGVLWSLNIQLVVDGKPILRPFSTNSQSSDNYIYSLSDIKVNYINGLISLASTSQSPIDIKVKGFTEVNLTVSSN